MTSKMICSVVQYAILQCKSIKCTVKYKSVVRFTIVDHHKNFYHTYLCEWCYS